MGILEVAQTAQTQLDELCAETGLPACELHVAVFTGKPDGWGIVFRPTWFGNLFTTWGCPLNPSARDRRGTHMNTLRWLGDVFKQIEKETRP